MTGLGQGPAAATHGDVTAVEGSGFGYWSDEISLFGGAQTDTGPTPTVSLAPDASNSPQTATATTGLVSYGPARLFTSDAITVESAGSLGTTGSATTTSDIQNVNYADTQPSNTGSEIFGYPPPETDPQYINFNPQNLRTSVAGSATADGSGVSGSTTITNGMVRTHAQSSTDCVEPIEINPCGRAGEAHTHEPMPSVVNPDSNPEGVVTIPANPPPNYTVAGHLHLGANTTDYFVLVFNEQVVNPDGSITVTPVHEYSGYKLDAEGNIVQDKPNAEGGSVLHGHLYLGQVTAGTHAPGLLRVTTNPALPSQISVDGVTRDTWGLTWMKIAPGSHTVCFRAVEGYTTPACQDVSVTSGATTEVTGTFVANGFLQAQTSPPLPGTIYVDGEPRNDWGMYTDLPTGSYEVCFGAVADYATPPCQTVTVNAGATTAVTGTYTESPGAPGPAASGFLRVTTDPARPSQISVDGIPRDSWGLTWMKIAPGSHTVCFRAVEGYTTPACQDVSVTSGATTEVTGTFVANGFLQAQTSPALPGTIYVDGEPRNDWGMYTDLPTGSYEVCFGAVPGYTAPPCRTVTLSAGSTTNTTGTYTAAT